MLLKFIDKIKLPNSPLDEIIDKLGGPASVAEMTGRHARVSRASPDERPRYELREAEGSGVESLNIQERNSFMNGSKLIAIISDAASTGISLHADQRVDNQRRRIHITAELPWSADKAVQQLGRSHRSNQTSGPIYKLLTTNLGGERRFAAAVAKRLQSLGAITKGDRRAATGADLTQFNFDTQYGRQALRAMYQAICQHQLVPGICLSAITDVFSHSNEDEDFFVAMKDSLRKMDLLEENTVGASVKEKDAGVVSKFLNRILGLAVRRQNMIFAYFCECLKAITSAAKKEGRYNEGVSDVKASSISMIGVPREVFTEARIGTICTKHVALNVDRGVTWEDAVKKLELTSGEMNGFYCSKREQRRRHLYLLAIQKEHSSHLFTITRPNTGMSPFEEEKADLLNRYKAISPEQAEIGWKEQYQRTEKHCIHGPNCKNSINCTVGCRTTQLHLLSGGIISLLSLLELTVVKHWQTLELSREQRNLRIVRVELNDGSRLVGLRYPEPLIAHVSQALRDHKAGRTDEESNTTTAIVEPEAPIDNRSKTKALSKPVTLKNFFKTSMSDECRFQITEKRQEQTESNYERCSQQAAVSGRRALSHFPTSGHVSFDNGSSLSKKAAKRKKPILSDKSTKKQKQTSILTAYTKMFGKEPPSCKRQPSSCPICKTDFENGISNEEINAHIDSCLIE